MLELPWVSSYLSFELEKFSNSYLHRDFFLQNSVDSVTKKLAWSMVLVLARGDPPARSTADWVLSRILPAVDG